jgi:hypothetical protein
MKTKNQLIRVRRNEGKIVVSFGEADLLRRANGRFELRGGTRSDRQDAREWVSLFKHEAAVEW